jgi:hypothetical protein
MMACCSGRSLVAGREAFDLRRFCGTAKRSQANLAAATPCVQASGPFHGAAG